MRLTTGLLIASLLQVSASTFGQRITMNQQNVPLKTLFKEIRKQSGFNFYYDGRIVSPEIRSSIQVSNVSVDEALKVLLAKLPLNYEIKDRLVIITKKAAPSFLENVIARFQAIDVRGRVLNEQNQPLAGATVTVKGKNQVTKTDAEGNFYLQNVDDKATLLISFVGFKPLELGVKEDLGVLILKLEDNSLDQVQVIAYGQVEKKFSTSNIGTVTAEEIQRQPVSNPILTLAGRVPGLLVTQRSGTSSSPTNISIQGSNSLQNSNDPFYVIDGVPYSSQFTNLSLGSSATLGSGNTFNFINPADIESISILKDADATAIYGSRAANGAILITTKKGLAGRTNVNLNIQNGWSKVTRKLDLVNTAEYLELRREGYVNDGLAVPTPLTTPARSNYDLTYWNEKKYTDLQEVLAGGTAKFNDLQGSISGGSSNTQFIASYGYHNETTVYPADFYDRKGNVRFNLNHISEDKRFKFTFTGSYLHSKNTLGNQDVAGLVTKLAPNIPDLYTFDGSLNFEYLPNNITTTLNNPLTGTVEKYTGKTSNLIADHAISYEVLKGLELKATLGYNRLQGDETLLRPIAYFPPNLANKTRTGSYLNKSIATWIAEPQLKYNKNTTFGVFDLLLGTTFQQSVTDLQKQFGSGFATDAQLPDITGATTRTIDAVDYEVYKYIAAFGRLNYRLNDKYILNINIRRDGSSRFGPESRFHTFFAFGGAWLFGDENLIKESLSWLSFGKLRGSYGTTGNDQIGNYRYLSLLDVYPQAQMAYQGGLSLQITKLDNPYLQWEETRKLNFGIDLGFLYNRVVLNLSYARNKSSNQLITNILPNITGGSGIDANFPAIVKNNSYEAQLTIIPLRTPRFSWNLSGNITIPKNELVSFPGFEGSGYESIYVIGKPLNIARVYDFAGVNPTTGLYQFRTAKGELTSDPSYSDDRIETIDVNPKFYGGIVNTLSYKGLQLDFLLQFVKQDGPTYKFGNYPGAINTVSLKNVLDRWRKPGDVTEIQKVGTSSATAIAFGAAQGSTGAYGNMMLFRMPLYFPVPHQMQ